MKDNDGFINISFNKGNLDRYYHRISIREAIENSLPQLNGTLLDAGCGKMPYRSYILNHSNVTEYVGLDIETARDYSSEIKPDVTWDGKSMPFDDNSFNCAIATEVLEHVPNAVNYLKEIYRALRDNGVFFFTTPFLWPLHEPPHDEYRYTPFALERLLHTAGFTDVSLNALGGWNASLGQMIGLWIRRSPMHPRKRKILKNLALPVMKYLYKHDNPRPDFYEGPMITGVAGLAYKR